MFILFSGERAFILLNGDISQIITGTIFLSSSVSLSACPLSFLMLVIMQTYIRIQISFLNCESFFFLKDEYAYEVNVEMKKKRARHVQALWDGLLLCIFHWKFAYYFGKPFFPLKNVCTCTYVTYFKLIMSSLLLFSGYVRVCTLNNIS